MKCNVINMHNIYKLLLFFALITVFTGKENLLFAQIRPNFSNPIISTDNYPRHKQKLDSIMNNAPFVFEGRMIKGGVTYGYKDKDGYFYSCYLFEIEKVYRGGERLHGGTVEVVSRIPNYMGEPSFVGFSDAVWYILFAKEVNTAGIFDANNDIKLEIYYNDTYYNDSHHGDISYFSELFKHEYDDRGNMISQKVTSYGGLSLKFNTQKELRVFLETYSLYPTDIPKADIIKKSTYKEAEEAARVITPISTEEGQKRLYLRLLQGQWHRDSISGKKVSKAEKENIIRQFENASEEERQELMQRQMRGPKPLMDSVRK